MRQVQLYMAAVFSKGKNFSQLERRSHREMFKFLFYDSKNESFIDFCSNRQFVHVCEKSFSRSHRKRKLFAEISQFSVEEKLKFVKAVRTDLKYEDKCSRCSGLFVHGSFYQNCNELTLPATDDQAVQGGV